MAQLEDYWTKVNADPRFQALPDDQKEEARKRLFERTVARSPSYLDAPETTKTAIRGRYDERVKLQAQEKGPSLLDKVGAAAKEALPKIMAPAKAAGDVVAAGTRAGVEMEKAGLKEGIEGAHKLNETIKVGEDAFPPTRMMGEALGKAKKGAEGAISGMEAAIEPTDQAMAETSKQTGSISPVQKARLAASGVAGTAGEFVAQAIPEDFSEVALYAAIPTVEKAAGRTFLGKDLFKSALPEVTSQLKVPKTISIEEDLHNMITTMLAQGEEKKPFEILARAEETAKYEKWLQDNDTSKPTDDRFQAFTDDMKTNHSQLRDAARASLEHLKREPVRLGELSRQERIDRTKLLPEGPRQPELIPERVPRRKGQAKLEKGYIPLGSADLPVGEVQTAAKGKPYALFIGNQDLGQGAIPYGTIYGEHENFRGTFPLEEIEKMGVPVTGREPRVPEGVKPAPKDPKTKSFMELAKDINQGMGERGSIGPGEPVDPERAAQLKANAQELIRRAKEIGLTTTEDILKFAAAHYAEAGKNLFHEAVKETVHLGGVEEWPTKEAESAMAGNKSARQSIAERSWKEFTDWKKSRAKSSLIVWKKAGDENTMAMKAYFFRHDALFGLSDAEKNAMPFYLQDASPKLETFRTINPDAERILGLAKKPTAGMIRAKELIRPYEDDAFKMLQQHSDKIQYLEDYVRQTWKNPDKYANWLDQKHGGTNPFEKHREFANFAEGIDAGFEPNSLDMNEILAREDALRIKTLSIYKVRGWLEEARTMDGKPALMPETNAPPDWQRLDHPAFRTDAGDRKVRMAISPEYKPLVKYLFQNKSTFLPVRLASMYNALSKQGNLAYSFFHGQTLVLDQFVAGQPIRRTLGLQKEFPWIAPSKSAPWQMVAGIGKSIGKEMAPPPEGFEGLSSVKQLTNRVQRAYKAYMTGNPILQNRKLALDAAEHGVSFDSVPDLEYNMLSKTLRLVGDTVGKAYPGLKSPFEMAAKGVDIQLRGIFTHVRNMGALITYESQLADNLKAFPEMPVEEVKMQTGKFVGKMFGGVAFTAMMASPKVVQFMHLIHFAPDWFYSTWMREQAVASGIARSAPGLLSGKGFKDPEARQATFWMARLALMYAVAGNSVNYAMTKKYMGKGRFMWENEPGHELDIYMGNETDPKTGGPGRVKYLIPGRGFTDPYDLYMNPWKYLVGRTSPAIHAAAAVLTGYGVGGYPLQGKTPADKAFQFAKRAAWPFSFTGQTAFFTYPVRKGMGYSQAKDLFLKSYETGDNKYRERAIQFGRENNLGGESLERADVEAQRKYHKDLIQ